MALEFHATELLSSLQKAKLSPGALVSATFEPLTDLKISFNGKEVKCGNYLKTGETKEAPSVEFALDGPESGSYTLILVDPDAPTPEDPKFAFWRHWVLPGLKPFSNTATQSTTTLTEYLGPGAKDISATPHRYIFLLFREPEAFRKLEKQDVGGEEFVDRRSFKADEFVKEHGLELVGVNWFLGVGDAFVGPVTLDAE